MTCKTRLVLTLMVLLCFVSVFPRVSTAQRADHGATVAQEFRADAPQKEEKQDPKTQPKKKSAKKPPAKKKGSGPPDYPNGGKGGLQ